MHTVKGLPEVHKVNHHRGLPHKCLLDNLSQCKDLLAARSSGPSITVAMIFPGVDSKVMPLQFEHSLMSPFFGRGIMIPFLHSFGTLPKRHTLLHSFASCTGISSPPCFIISGHILSLPAAFPIFRFLIARC